MNSSCPMDAFDKTSSHLGLFVSPNYLSRQLCSIERGNCEGGCLGSSKNFKKPFYKDIENSFHEVTHIGLEPTQFFPFKISQQIQSQQRSKVFAKMGRSWQAV